jgi:hypothetical protein
MNLFRSNLAESIGSAIQAPVEGLAIRRICHAEDDKTLALGEVFLHVDVEFSIDGYPNRVNLSLVVLLILGGNGGTDAISGSLRFRDVPRVRGTGEPVFPGLPLSTFNGRF